MGTVGLHSLLSGLGAGLGLTQVDMDKMMRQQMPQQTQWGTTTTTSTDDYSWKPYFQSLTAGPHISKPKPDGFINELRYEIKEWLRK